MPSFSSSDRWSSINRRRWASTIMSEGLACSRTRSPIYRQQPVSEEKDGTICDGVEVYPCIWLFTRTMIPVVGLYHYYYEVFYEIRYITFTFTSDYIYIGLYEYLPRHQFKVTGQNGTGRNGSNFYRFQFNLIEFVFSNHKSQISDKPKRV